MNFRRFWAAALCAALVLSTLSGCGSQTQEDPAPSGSSSQEQGEFDLSQVSDPILSTAGVAQDAVVATAGQAQVTAGQWLQWAASYVDTYFYDGSIPWTQEVAEGVTLEQSIKEGAMEMAQLYALLPLQAAQEGVDIPQSGMDEALEGLDQMEADLGSAQMVDHYLWQLPMTREMYMELRRGALASAALQEARYGENGHSRPTDAQVLEFAKTEGGIAYRAKHILLSTVDTSKPILTEDGMPTGEYEPLAEDVVQAKYQLAQELVDQLKASQDPVTLFDTLMKEHGEDPGAQAQPDGYDAYLGQMVPTFEAAALELKEGEFSGIVESPFGYHIILRLPIIAAKYRESCGAFLMNQDNLKLLDQNPAVTTDLYHSLDLAAFYEQLSALRAAVGEELALLEEN